MKVPERERDDAEEEQTGGKDERFPGSFALAREGQDEGKEENRRHVEDQEGHGNEEKAGVLSLAVLLQRGLAGLEGFPFDTVIPLFWT